MDKEIDLEVIKRTQKILGKHVKKPPLTEKLLKRPPFRFLHDIITSIIHSYGFFEGLFDKEELISENVKDKESKMLFLNKAIAILSIATGERVDVKPSKIVAGQEIEKTNKFLQQIGTALTNKVSTKAAVQQYKQKGNEGNDSKTKIVKKKKRDESVESTHSSEPKLVRSTSKVSLLQKNESHERKVNKTRDKSIEKQSKVNSESMNLKKSSSRESSLSKRITSKNKDNPETARKVVKGSMIKKTDLNNEVQNQDIKQIQESPVILESKKTNIAATGTEIVEQENLQEIAKHITESAEEEVIDHISNRNTQSSLEKSSDNIIAPKENTPKLHREEIKRVEPPFTSNAELPKESRKITSQSSLDERFVAEKKELKRSLSSDESVQRIGSARPPSARPGAPRVRSKLNDIVVDDVQTTVSKVKVIIENKEEEKEDEETTIVEQSVDESLRSLGDEEAGSQPPSIHGHLVQQILDTQREFNQTQGKKTDEWDVSALKAWSEKAEETRTAIRGVARAVTPLGRLLQLARHHADAMRHERVAWTTKLREVNAQLNEHRAANEMSLLPMHAKLKQLEGEVLEKREKTDDLKAITYRNAQRIDKLLESGSVQ